MATVISNNAISNHNVNKYNFKVIASGAQNDEEESSEQVNFSADNHPSLRSSDVDSSALSNKSKESLIESLMQKTDEMSSNFIKLQMKLESKEEEHKLELQQIKEDSFAEGIEAGKAKAIQDGDVKVSEAIKLFSQSVTKLDNSAVEFESALESIKEELISAALDISKEVVSVEVGENSAGIAKVLASGLIKELQSASKITLKVNPMDHGIISEHVGSLKHVEVVSDSAISKGGVVAISDAGNIDAEISKRFDRVKKAALSE